MLDIEIRVCRSCGLRYPLVSEQAFGARCPKCLGETRVVSTRVINPETPYRPGNSSCKTQLAVVLDNIRSAWNVGSVFRSADGFGFSHLYLCGITPTPKVAAVNKTALGAEESVHWSYHVNAAELVGQLKQDGWKILALEEDARAIPLGQADPQPRTALILGSEVTGVDPELLDLSDKILYIPMRGQKRSFNVASAFAVAAYALAVDKELQN